MSKTDRKRDHINKALKSLGISHDDRFYYEPLLAAHPTDDQSLELSFLNKKMKAPLWISSMTGGTTLAKKINKNLATVCGEFGLGMGLGSCRLLLENNKHFKDFNLRKVIGDQSPFYANLGISQIEKSISENRVNKIKDMVDRLEVDGLIIHINPLQEWFQPEGDRLKRAPIAILKDFLSIFQRSVIVKEVGQGMGPKSLKELVKLPIAAVEFASFGGTNFSQIELDRNGPVEREVFGPYVGVGHTAEEMVNFINRIVKESDDQLKCKEFIVSGGICSILDGHYLRKKLVCPCVIGQAKPYLNHALTSLKSLRAFVKMQIEALCLAESYLHVK